MISVIVPCYQCAETLKKCVDSIRKQSYIDMEILLIDDGSPDKTGEVCDNLSETDSRIQVIHQKNKGLVGAWKRGVLEARGEYINFVDSDDWMEVNALSEMVEKIEKYGAEMVICGAIIEYPNGKQVLCDNHVKEGFYNRKDIEERILPYFFHIDSMESRPLIISRWSKLICKDLLMKNFHIFDEKISYGEDDMTIFTLVLSSQSLYCFNNYFPYHYCRNDVSMIGRYDAEWFEKCHLLNDKLLEIAKTKNYSYYSQLEINYLETIFLNIKKYMHRNKENNIFEIAKRIQQVMENKETKRMISDCMPVIHRYGLKERLFIYLLRYRCYLLCIFIVRMLVKMKISVQ